MRSICQYCCAAKLTTASDLVQSPFQSGVNEWVCNATFLDEGEDTARGSQLELEDERH